MSPAPRRPRGYLGLNHTTRGGDILAVLQAVNLPEQTLGKELVARLRNVEAEKWYPATDMFELLERLDAKLGGYHLRQVGWTIVQKYHAAQVKEHFTSAQELLKAFDGLYREANRGQQIGGWKLLSFNDTQASMEKTTMHHCGMEEGILEELLRTLGVYSKIVQVKCVREDDDCCQYTIEPRSSDSRWHGRP